MDKGTGFVFKCWLFSGVQYEPSGALNNFKQEMFGLKGVFKRPNSLLRAVSIWVAIDVGSNRPAFFKQPDKIILEPGFVEI